MSERISRALARAQACAETPCAELASGSLAGNSAERESTGSAGDGFARRWAIGDPQAPIERFFAILDRYDLLSDDGWLAPDVYLLSMGDHFDWGASAEREQSAADGLAIMAWLAAHSRRQVGLILGNHDLGRIGELASFDDPEFLAAHELAAAAYRGGDVDREAERALLERYPHIPTAELLARDFAAFVSAQRDLVLAMLRAERLRVAISVDERTLACHAGVTRDQLAALGLDRTGVLAGEIATALHRALTDALASWDGTALSIEGLHRPGDREFGEGGGMFYHRPSNPVAGLPSDQKSDSGSGHYRRRYDARRLPLGLTQIVGHIADGKCRKLLGSWVSATPTPAGGLRHLRTNGVQASYRPGLPGSVERATDDAIMIFTDGRMARTAPADYQLLDLSRVTGGW